MWRNRTLWLPGLTALTLALAGCVESGTDDSAFQFSWDVAYTGGGTPVSCRDAGTPTVSLQARHLQTNSVYTSSQPCAAGGATTEVLPSGPYEVTLSLLDAQGRPMAALPSGQLDINRHGLTPLTPVQFQVQSWKAAWTLAKAAGAGTTPITCSDVGGKTVDLVTQAASDPPETFSFDCAAGTGATPAIQTGTYGWKFRLLDASGAAIAETALALADVGQSKRASASGTFVFK